MGAPSGESTSSRPVISKPVSSTSISSPSGSSRTEKSSLVSDAAQQEAIRHGRGPCAVIAGPGSGKTHVLTRRVSCLIQDLGVDPRSILVMTFSRAAASEMRKRFTQGQEAGADVVFGTFHSVFYRILRESSGEELRIISQAEKYRYLQHLCGLHPGRLFPRGLTPEGLQLLISRSKNGLPCPQPWLPGLIRDYDRYLRDKGCLDFDDMILLCQKVLREDPGLLAYWRSRFQWFLVDEFQDVSPSQYETLRLLAAPLNNLFVVGDDDQSIYGFRGADALTLQRFLDDYGLNGKDPSLKGGDCRDLREQRSGRILLTTNYRCGRAILQAGARLIRDNRQRIPKDFRPGSSRPGSFVCRPFSDNDSQYAFLTQELKAMPPENLSSTAVIFRSHGPARSFLQVLQREGIPFLTEKKTVSPRVPTAEGRILGDLAAYYRASAGLARGGAARKDLLRIMNCPERFLSGSFLEGDLSGGAGLVAGAGYEEETVRELVDDLEVLQSLSPAFSLRYLLDNMGYRAYAAKTFQEGGAVLDRLAGLARDCSSLSAWLGLLEDLSGEAERGADPGALLEKAGQGRREAEEGPDPGGSGRKSPGTGEGGVRVLTMHACKGLEFDRVYIPGLNEGVLPARQAWTLDQIEEERRLLYVAMTRARQSLTLTWLEGTRDRPAAPSRFLRPFIVRV